MTIELVKIAGAFSVGLVCGIQWGLHKKHIKAEIKRQRRLALARARWMAVDFRMRWETRKTKKHPIIALLNAHNQTVTYKGNFNLMTEEQFAELIRNKDDFE